MRTNKIFPVTVARYAVMYVEADSVTEAMIFARRHCDELSDSAFWDSENDVDSCQSYPDELEDYMEEVWTKDGKLTYEEYESQLEEND